MYFDNLLIETNEKKIVYGGQKWDLQTIERIKNEKALERYGYKVFSQNDEDGIIEEIFNRIGTTNKTFVEFGLQDGLECNTHYLLYKGWNGLWIEGSEEYCKKIRRNFCNLLKNNKLKVANRFIDKENINEIILSNNITGEIDLLCVDIDGNDYYVLDSIEVINPRVIIVEYNGKFPPCIEWVMPYDKEHIWNGTDLYGASLKSFEILGRKKGYSLVGTNISGYNAFFIRNDLLSERFLTPYTAEYMYNPMRKNLMYECGHPSNFCLADMRDGAEGVMDFYQQDNYYDLYGFYPQENYRGKNLCWMSSLEGKICVSVQPEQKAIVLHTILLDRKLLGNYTVSVEGDDIKRCESVIKEIEDSITVNINENFVGNTVSLIIKIPCMWEPDAPDTRKLGIGIIRS